MGLGVNMIEKINPETFQITLNKYLDFHRAYLFRVMFFDEANADWGFVTDMVSATETPTSSTTQMSLGWMGSKLKLAGKTDFGDWKVTVRDDLANNAYAFFYDWRNLVYSLNGGITQPITQYKKSAIVFMLANHSKNFDTWPRRYTISGIWPKDIGSINLDFTSESVTTFPITFSVDYFEASDG